MTAASDIPAMGAPLRQAVIRKWRRRSRAIYVLRILLPVVIGLILAWLAGAVAYNAITSQRTPQGNASDPIRLVNPHFVGRDSRGRPFVLTSVTATRDPNDYERVFLDHPVLVLDAEGADPTHITANAGIYHQDTGKLEVSRGVRMSDARGAFDTDSSLFDTKTGELVGSVDVQGAGTLGEIQAKSYGVYDKGARMVFTGGVHTRLQPK
jgi:lipopolysaccharide export system protein LptC